MSYGPNHHLRIDPGDAKFNSGNQHLAISQKYGYLFVVPTSAPGFLYR